MSLSGMTGFGRAEGAHGAWTWAVEARSVNGRNLEVRFRGPPGFDALERQAREGAQARLQRGQVTVGIQARRAESAAQATINVEQLERYLAVTGRLVDEGRATTPNADGLLALRGVIETGEETDDPETRAAVEAAMAVSLSAALDALAAARREEGVSLAPVLTGLVDRIESLVTAAEAEAALQPAALKERFERRMVELVGEAASPDRIVQ
ncbi:MAG: hypothetical protein J0I28_07815 [Caulobacterales bacterium]|nr:hypothetical protein [Caulobacterales bacterium]